MPGTHSGGYAWYILARSMTLGDRVSQTAGSETEQYVLDMNAGLTQVLSDGTNTYLYGQGRVAQESEEKVGYFLPDGLGSVRTVVMGGEVVSARDYTPYGEELAATGVDSSAFGFAGEWMDSSGLQYLRTRYYDPGVGRFISRDSWEGDENRPISQNKWLYAYGNPVNLTDPSGLDPIDEIAGRITEQIGKCYEAGDLNCVWLGYWTIATGGSVQMPHASNHLFRFLYSQGNIYYNPPEDASGHWTSDWVKYSQTIRTNLSKIDDDILDMIQSKAHNGENQGSFTTNPKGIITLREERDLYYAMNIFQVSSDGGFEIDCNKLIIRPTYRFYDNYDWHPQLSAGGNAPGVAGLKDEWTQALVDAGMAKSYEIFGYWRGTEKTIFLPTNWINLPIGSLHIYN